MEPHTHLPDTGTKPIQCSENSEFKVNIILNTLLGEPVEDQEPDEILTEQIIFVEQVQALG